MSNVQADQMDHAGRRASIKNDGPRLWQRGARTGTTESAVLRKSLQDILVLSWYNRA